MRRLLLSCLLILALPVACLAQQMQINVPAQTVKPGAVSCPAGQAVTGFDANGNLICAAFGGSTVTISSPAGSGISVTGGPAYVLSAKWPVVTKTGATTFACADASATYALNSATPATFSLPGSGGIGCTNGTAFCFKNWGAGTLTISSSSPLSGGAVVLNQGQDECVQADDTGKWMITGFNSAVANPNPFQ